MACFFCQHPRLKSFNLHVYRFRFVFGFLAIHINHTGMICSEALGERRVLISDAVLRGRPDKATKKPSRTNKIQSEGTCARQVTFHLSSHTPEARPQKIALPPDHEKIMDNRKSRSCTQRKVKWELKVFCRGGGSLNYTREETKRVMVCRIKGG